MFKHYDIKDYTMYMEVEIMPPSVVASERKQFNSTKRELKQTIYKYYYYKGFFNDKSITESDLKYIQKGCSPIVRANGKETQKFSIHHIKPLNCGGTTHPDNLIPLPKCFHQFVHDKIITPQIEGLKIGEKKVLVGIPDFSKITLEMMNDSGFRIQYFKWLVDEYKIMPKEVKDKTKSNETFNLWYKNKFNNGK